LQKIALIAFPPIRVGQASAQNSATPTFLQGAQFIQQEKQAMISLQGMAD
jgi:hypothetical protein